MKLVPDPGRAKARSRTALTALSIRSVIERALHDFVVREASRIDIRIVGRVVRLEGSVASWAARQVIVKAVKAAVGDAEVDASLLVWRSDRGPRTRVYAE